VPRSSFEIAREELARNLRTLRAARRLSQVKLGLAAGISAAEVSMIERSKGNPTIETLQCIADALGVEVAALFAGRE
jgi:transcriptional regulator with XRE-family HTH domain